MKNILTKLLSVALAIITLSMAFVLTACGDNQTKTEQNTIITDNNDGKNEDSSENNNDTTSEEIAIDSSVSVKITNINADVYGEFAIYSQFVGSGGVDDVTPSFAKRVTPSGSLTNNGYKSRSEYEHGYLLYAVGIGGYNNGSSHNFSSEYEYINQEFGYGKFISEANNNHFIATKFGQPKQSSEQSNGLSIRDEGEFPYLNSYTIDKSTQIAQIVYMYTINQWESDGADNAICGKLAATPIEGVSSNFENVVKIIPQLYIGKLREDNTSITDWTQMSFNSVGETYFEMPSTYKSEENSAQTYYILLAYTFVFGVNNSSFKMLQETISHNLSLFSIDGKEDGQDYTPITSGGDLVYMASKSTIDEYGNIRIEGKPFYPNTTEIKEQIVGAYNQDRLKNTFALIDPIKNNDNSKTFLPSGENGFIYLCN